MKTLIKLHYEELVLLVMILFGVFVIPAFCHAETTYKQEGNKIVAISNNTRKSGEEIKTSYTYVDSKGKEYPIFKSNKGAYYVKKISAKTGKEYRYYLPKEATKNLK